MIDIFQGRGIDPHNSIMLWWLVLPQELDNIQLLNKESMTNAVLGPALPLKHQHLPTIEEVIKLGLYHFEGHMGFTTRSISCSLLTTV